MQSFSLRNQQLELKNVSESTLQSQPGKKHYPTTYRHSNEKSSLQTGKIELSPGFWFMRLPLPKEYTSSLVL